jgi:putative transposase
MGYYWTGSHTKYRLMYHLVWLPKYRKRILKGVLASRLRELFLECAAINSWKIIELNIQKDHIHMIVKLKQTVSVSQAVQRFKGGSSKVIRSEFPELKEFLWGKNFWAEGYFAETVGRVEESVIKKYVRNQ